MSSDTLTGLIWQLNIADDAIMMDSKIRDIHDFCQDIISDQQLFSNWLDDCNPLALKSAKFATKLAVFLATRSALHAHRTAILRRLQANHAQADELRSGDPTPFYNSIALLGEFSHRARDHHGNPFRIINNQLYHLLSTQLAADIERFLRDPSQLPDVRFAGVILRQLALNATLKQARHPCEPLLFEIRRCLVLVGGSLCARFRALLLMALDLHYAKIGKHDALEQFYGDYLQADDDDADPQDAADAIEQRIGLHAHTAHPTPAVQSIGALGDELSKKASGFQRPAGIRPEYVNRPLRAADRLQFIRQQNADNQPADGDEPEMIMSLEQITLQPGAVPRSPNKQRSALRSNPNTPPVHQPLGSPRSNGLTGGRQSGPTGSLPVTPTKTPPVRRRPHSPPLHSDWTVVSSVQKHFEQGFRHGIEQPTASRSQPTTPPRRTAPPAGLVRGSAERQSEPNRSPDKTGRPADGKPAKRRRGGRNRNKRNSSASKTSLPSTVSTDGRSSAGGRGQPASVPPQRPAKPAAGGRNANNPFDRRRGGKATRTPPSNRHSEHCDRGNAAEEAAADDWNASPQSPHAARPIMHNPHAEQYAREFLQFLDD